MLKYCHISEIFSQGPLKYTSAKSLLPLLTALEANIFWDIGYIVEISFKPKT